MDQSSRADTQDNLYVFIADEAEVRTVPMWALPVSTLRKMGVQGVPRGSVNTESTTVTWISPVEIRERGRLSHGKDSTRANVNSLVTKQRAFSPDPHVMQFVTRNRAAFGVLEDFQRCSRNPNEQTPARSMVIPCHDRALPHKDAVVIHHGRLYLSVRRPPLVRSCLNSPASPTPQTASQKPCSVSSHDSNMKILLQGFGVTKCVHVALSRVCREDLRRGTTVEGHLEEETQGTDHTMQEQSKQQRTDDFSSLQTAGDEEIETTGGDEKMETIGDDKEIEITGGAEEETFGENDTEMEEPPAAIAPATIATTGGDEEIETTGRAEEETFGGVDTEMEEPPAANLSLRPVFRPAMSQLHAPFDYDELALEERINRTRAKLREKEAALSLFPSD